VACLSVTLLQNAATQGKVTNVLKRERLLVVVGTVLVVLCAIAISHQSHLERAENVSGGASYRYPSVMVVETTVSVPVTTTVVKTVTKTVKAESCSNKELRKENERLRRQVNALNDKIDRLELLVDSLIGDPLQDKEVVK
jgi:hypothetical protein